MVSSKNLGLNSKIHGSVCRTLHRSSWLSKDLLRPLKNLTSTVNSRRMKTLAWTIKLVRITLFLNYYATVNRSKNIYASDSNN